MNEEKDYTKTFKVYLAGPLNAAHADGYIKNLHKMCKKGSELIKAGYSVFIPGIDMLAGVIDGDWGYDEYFDNSQPWLISADAVYIMEGWQESKGTVREIGIANDFGIPVVDNDKDLEYYRNMLEQHREDMNKKNEMIIEHFETMFRTEPASIDDVMESIVKETLDKVEEPKCDDCSCDSGDVKCIGRKYDEGKLRYDLIPVEALEGIAQIFTHGAGKYGDYNWLKVTPVIRYYAAAMRHITDHLKGEVFDKDSGLRHLDHAITSLIMFRELTK